jgi:hypothetical protein
MYPDNQVEAWDLVLFFAETDLGFPAKVFKAQRGQRLAL